MIRGQLVSVHRFRWQLGDYYWMGRALVPGVELDYHCKDIAGASSRLDADSSEVTFHTDDACLDGSYDLVMFSSSINVYRIGRTSWPRRAVHAPPPSRGRPDGARRCPS